MTHYSISKINANIRAKSISEYIKPNLYFLIVDDNLFNINSRKNMLQIFLKDSFDLIIHSTTEGLDSITMIKKAKPVYDIIFMDVNMPVFSIIHIHILINYIFLRIWMEFKW